MGIPSMTGKHITVHNAGFYKPQVREINCMQLQPKTMLLAVSRSDHTIEIWNVAHLPYLQRLMLPGPGSSVEDMQWCGSRLFSCGFQGAIIEHNMVDGSVKSTTTVTGGVAWALSYNLKSNLLAVGTEDGFINVLEVTESGLEHLKLLDKQQGRILCISWDEPGTHLVTGSIDVIRVWNYASGHAVHKMTTGRSTSNRETIVWTLTVTQDFTIISGDSRGYLTFWDGKLGTQVESFRSHDADILAVALASEGAGLVCTGVDPVLAVYGRVMHRGGKRQWARGGLHRIHDHDVRALAIAPNGTIYSGGVSGFLSVINPSTKLRLSYPPFLKGSCAQVVRKLRQVLLRYQDCVQLWQLGTAITDSADADSPQLLSTKPKCLLKIDSKAGQVLLCAAISAIGNNIAISSQNSLQFYAFKQMESSVLKFDEEFEASSHLQFFSTVDQTKCIAVTLKNSVCVFEVNDNIVDDVHSFQPSLVSCIKETITHLEVSPCGSLFALADCGSNIAIWSTANWSVVASLPRYLAVPTALTFSLDSTTIIIAHSDFYVVEYNIKQKKYTDFVGSLSNCGAFHSAIKGILIDPRKNAVIFQDEMAFCAINKRKTADVDVTPAKTSRESEVAALGTLKPSIVIKKFQYIADAAWLENDEMLIIEVTPLSLTESLVPLFAKKKFGT